ncbi:MAG TPA: phage tail protein [Pseudonocardiaceae bacterium]|jgi:phage tail-like protein|nr:phage tail protein [Pseudonocardiaceae bacterium]
MPTFLSSQLASPTVVGRTLSDQPGVPVPSPADYPVYGLVMRFGVQVDELTDLGNWSSCKGLTVEFKTRLVHSGGNYTSATVLPERVEYQRITLERAMRTPDSTRVLDWLTRVQSQWMSPGQSYSGCAASIRLLNPVDQRTDLMTWTLREVYPVSWSGPSFSAKGNDLAMETLVLQHGGFL